MNKFENLNNLLRSVNRDHIATENAVLPALRQLIQKSPNSKIDVDRALKLFNRLNDTMQSILAISDDLLSAEIRKKITASESASDTHKTPAPTRESSTHIPAHPPQAIDSEKEDKTIDELTPKDSPPSESEDDYDESEDDGFTADCVVIKSETIRGYEGPPEGITDYALSKSQSPAPAPAVEKPTHNTAPPAKDTKKQRKPRNDAGKPRGPRKKETEVPSPAPAPAVEKPTHNTAPPAKDTKKQRKPRNDAGKPRGPRKKETEVPSPAPAPAVEKPSHTPPESIEDINKREWELINERKNAYNTSPS